MCIVNFATLKEKGQKYNKIWKKKENTHDNLKTKNIIKLEKKLYKPFIKYRL